MTTDLAEQIRNGTADLTNLSGANLHGANLYGANLYGAYLTRADLTRADLTRADLTRADLTWADLSGANLSGADLSGADLSGADLSGANLSGANLSGADLSGANLSDTNLSCCRGVVWAQVGPIGTDGRSLTAVVQPWGDDPTSQTVFHAGCFHGTPTEFFAACEAGGKGWGWPEDDWERLQTECVEAGQYCERIITRQLETGEVTT